jgi:hypothetical protein
VSQPNYIRSHHLRISYVAMVQCLRCRRRVPIEVDSEDLRRLRAFERLRRPCGQCGEDTEWQYLPLGVSR